MTNGLPKHKTSGLTRFFVVLFSIVAIVVTYAFAFQRTDVSLDAIKDENRRTSLVRIIRGIARPDLIEYDEIDTFHTVQIMVPCPDDGFVPEAPDTTGPYLEASPSCAAPGEHVTVTGHNFTPGTKAPVSFIPAGTTVTLRLAAVTVDQQGEFTADVRMPDRPSAEVQDLRMTTSERVGSWRLTKSAKDTWEKIIETVMLALVATTLGTIAAVPLSFLSARNLMRTIRTPIVSVGLFVIGLPVGLLTGRAVGRWVTAVGSHMATNVLLLAAAIAGIGAVAWFALRVTLPAEDAEPPTLQQRIVRRIVVAGVAVAAMFVLGFTGNLLREIGTHLEDWLGPLGFMGGFFRVIGDVLATFIGAVAAIVGAAAAAMIGSRTGHIIADRAKPAALLTARYIVLSLAVAVIAVGIGGAVHWLYELQPSSNLMSTTAGGALLAITGIVMAARFGRRWFPERLGLLATLLRLINSIVWVGVSGAVGILIGYLADKVAGFLGASGTLLGPALVGMFLGAVGVSVSRKLHSLPSGMSAYYFARTLFNGIRSVEPLIMAIVFVVWVGVGPFAGALALSLHTTAALAKLYSEQVESISQGPIEAVTATGATRLQSIIYAVVPQIVPPYIAFTLYRWDINVRMSTIIGFAGGGGIGFLLQQNINLLLYRAAAVQMLAIAIVVSTLDFVSARIRERIV